MKSASIQPRTSPSKFGGKFNSFHYSFASLLIPRVRCVGLRADRASETIRRGGGSWERLPSGRTGANPRTVQPSEGRRCACSAKQKQNQHQMRAILRDGPRSSEGVIRIAQHGHLIRRYLFECSKRTSKITQDGLNQEYFRILTKFVSQIGYAF